ncbi:uncharacterized protein LOC111709006 isoform X2 [Eurytemora carolleeae]|nr:uncharacterized protein LOC111709006 isoform X2 [Eurytemora carolleeae]|eukprot:XP_023338338.1 uncharacterized protein LOC111709006 isoform X2 [Eurytemora affinis]
MYVVTMKNGSSFLMRMPDIDVSVTPRLPDVDVSEAPRLPDGDVAVTLRLQHGDVSVTPKLLNGDVSVTPRLPNGDVSVTSRLPDRNVYLKPSLPSSTIQPRTARTTHLTNMVGLVGSDYGINCETMKCNCDGTRKKRQVEACCNCNDINRK